MVSCEYCWCLCIFVYMVLLYIDLVTVNKLENREVIKFQYIGTNAIESPQICCYNWKLNWLEK